MPKVVTRTSHTGGPFSAGGDAVTDKSVATKLRSECRLNDMDGEW